MSRFRRMVAFGNMAGMAGGMMMQCGMFGFLRQRFAHQVWQ